MSKAFTKKDAAALLEQSGRARFDDSTKDEALRYFLDNTETETLKSVAEQYGMSTQTLVQHRNKVLVEHGLREAPKVKPKAPKAE